MSASDDEIDLGGGACLRPWRFGDEEPLVRHANDAEVSRHLRDRFPFPYTLADAKGWVAFNQDVRPVSNFAIDLRGEPVGGAGYVFGEDVLRFNAEVGYWLGRAHWGKGLATRALAALTRHGFERLGLHRLHASVFEGNDASARVLCKCGYAREGVARRAAFKHGRFVDVWEFARLRDDDAG